MHPTYQNERSALWLAPPAAGPSWAVIVLFPNSLSVHLGGLVDQTMPLIGEDAQAFIGDLGLVFDDGRPVLTALDTAR